MIEFILWALLAVAAAALYASPLYLLWALEDEEAKDADSSDRKDD